MFSPEQIEQLSAKLDAKHVKARTQAGRQLSYVEGWHAIAEANRIFGFSDWDRTLAALKQVTEPREIDGKWRVSYLATVRVTVRTDDGQDVVETVRDGTGYGSGIDRDLGSAHESAIKEAETDAMKRALMTFGNPFGLALYDKTQENVETHSAPTTGRIAPAAARTPAAGAPLSELGETFRKTMMLSLTKDDLGGWMSANTDTMKEQLGEQEASQIRTMAAARYRELPEAQNEAAE